MQPNAIAFQGPSMFENLIRWVGNEDGTAPYPCWATANETTDSDGTVAVKGLHGDPNAKFWCPGEADFPLRWNRAFQGGWFWKAGEDDKLFTVEQLMKKYETSVGRNTNMLVGVVIDSVSYTHLAPWPPQNRRARPTSGLQRSAFSSTYLIVRANVSAGNLYFKAP